MIEVSFEFKVFMMIVFVYWIILIIWALIYKLRAEEWENTKKQDQIHVIIENLYED